MKAKTKFLRLYKQMPEPMRKELIFFPYDENAMTLQVLKLEVDNDTSWSKIALKDLGFEDDDKV